jgi:hypothetical protein
LLTKFAESRFGAEQDPRVVSGVLAQNMRSVGIETAVVEKDQRGPASEIPTVAERDRALVEIPIRRIAAGISMNHMREKGRNKVHPLLIREQTGIGTRNTIEREPLLPPPKKL